MQAHARITVTRDIPSADIHTKHYSLSHEWHDSCVCNTTHKRLISAPMQTGHDSFMCGTYEAQRVRMWHCDTTYSYVTWLIDTWHDSFISGTTLLTQRDQFESCRTRGARKYTRSNKMQGCKACHVTHQRVTHERVMLHINESCHMWRASCHIWVRHVTWE